MQVQCAANAAALRRHAETRKWESGCTWTVSHVYKYKMRRELRTHLQEITKFLLFRFTDKADEESGERLFPGLLALSLLNWHG